MQFQDNEWIDLHHSVQVGSEGSFGIRISMAGTLAHPAITKKYEWGASGEDAEPADVSDFLNKVYHAANDLANDVLRINFVRDETNVEEGKHMKARLLAAFPSPLIYAEEVPNEYWGKAYYAATRPWFIVTTHRGRIKVGWRKRVIHIDWSDSEVKACGEELFPDEDVTKSQKYDTERYIHAWGYDKLAEYLKVILSAT